VIAVFIEKSATYLLTLKGAPVLDVIDGKSVGGLWVRHCGECEELSILNVLKKYRCVGGEGQPGVFEALTPSTPHCRLTDVRQ
jgi:hypothetical protein